MRDFRQVKVWQRAHRLSVDLYRTTSRFPRSETEGLTRQIRECSATISSSIISADIARVWRRGANSEFATHLSMAISSANELENHLVMARDLDLLQPGDYGQFETELAGVKRMLTSLMRTFRPGRW